MADELPVRGGQILTGSVFPEPMRVETVTASGPAAWTLGLVGVQTDRFRRVTLTEDQLAGLAIVSPSCSYSGDGALVRLGLQAYALGIAWEYDPFFGLSVSRVDPLPHQLEAVYDYLLKLARVRFLLADDAGAGKTIMAGLLLRELKLRGLAERILIVAPANLAFQWQRELREKFDESFVVLQGSELRAQYGVNPWLQHSRVVTSLDLAKRADILPSLQQSHWNLVIVDEAHRMSATAEDRKSLRYKLGERLRDITEHYLLLTATPHRGDPENFTSLDTTTGELRLIEVKGLGAATGRILLTPNERRVAEDRRDCYWLYVVADCDTTPRLEPVKDPARFAWHEVRKVEHYWLEVDTLTQPMRVREEPEPYGDRPT